MSCNRHHRHHHNSHHQPSPCCCSNTRFCCSSSHFNCSCNSNCCSSNTTPSPISSSSSSSSDLLLQTLLLIQSQSQPQPQPHHPIFLKPQPNRDPRPRPCHRFHSQPKEHDDDADPSLHLLHSLIRRVASLESSLSKISPSPPQNQPQQQRGQSSLKHAAAATIQRCFRRFLARRSRTLRDLKHLASIKSQAAALRSSLSDNAHHRRNPRALSHRAMDLLFQLDSIQSADPMIREGKRSVSKELVRISEFVDKVLISEKEVEVEELERTVERARRVSFAAEENGDGDDNVFDDLPERNPEEEEVQGFYVPISDDGKESHEVVRHDRFTNGGFRKSNGGLGLAAPLPEKMEPRRTVSLKKVAIEED